MQIQFSVFRLVEQLLVYVCMYVQVHMCTAECIVHTAYNSLRWVTIMYSLLLILIQSLWSTFCLGMFYAHWFLGNPVNTPIVNFCRTARRVCSLTRLTGRQDNTGHTGHNSWHTVINRQETQSTVQYQATQSGGTFWRSESSRTSLTPRTS
jgi:hypothetical protein